MSGLSDANLIARCGLYTASAVGKCMFLDPTHESFVKECSRIAQEQIDGVVVPTEPNMFMQHGIDNEDAAVLAFGRSSQCNIYGNDVTPNKDIIKCVLTDPEGEDGRAIHCGATPDALMLPGNQPIELKTPYTQNNWRNQIQWAEWVKSNMTNEDCPDEFKYIRQNFWQLAYQMWVVERAYGERIDSGHIAYYDSRSGKIRGFELNRFDYIIKRIEAKVVEMDDTVQLMAEMIDGDRHESV